MGNPGAHRFLQANAAMARAMNRAAGLGAGYGMAPAHIGGSATSAGYVAGITNAAWSTIASITLQTRTQEVLIWANLVFNRTAGVIADTFYAEIQMDSAADWVPALGIVDGGTILAGAPNDVTSRPLFLFKGAFLQGGPHTFNLKATVNGDTFQAQGSISVVVPS